MKMGQSNQSIKATGNKPVRFFQGLVVPAPYFFRSEEDMNELTTRQMKNLFTVIEVNLILWLIVCGAVWSSSVEAHVKYFAGAGMIISAFLQHWAYYNIYKKTKEARKK